MFGQVGMVLPNTTHGLNPVQCGLTKAKSTLGLDTVLFYFMTNRQTASIYHCAVGDVSCLGLLLLYCFVFSDHIRSLYLHFSKVKRQWNDVKLSKRSVTIKEVVGNWFLVCIHVFFGSFSETDFKRTISLFS